MRKEFLFLVIIIFFSLDSFAQFTKYVVSFTDKAGTPFSISDPSKFLSEKAIERRAKQHIAIDETDLPIVSAYIDSIRSVENVTVLDGSKWLNQICIATADSLAILKINSFSFVAKTSPVKRLVRSNVAERNQSPEWAQKNKFSKETKGILSPASPPVSGNYYSYGNSYAQVHIHNGEYLHNNGFRGKGMLIAIIDAGFYHYRSLPAFDSVNLNNKIIDTYDFVDNEASVDEDNYHGMMCFSIIAGNIPGELVGSCPDANFLLYRSEDVASESPVEEQYWIAAAERADSAGADIISTSLGYNTFDNPVFDYTYKDMNGHTSMIAKAATLAAKKGMIVLAAAGNEGDDSWHYITTPGDADSIITVGAVDTLGIPAPFSSYGPSSDGRVKPTAASVGSGTAISSTSGTIQAGSGTSFATPNLAGLVTCLWQAFPDFTNMQIIDAVKKSSSIYNAPDNRIGYGLPDFKKAFDDLTNQEIIRNIAPVLQNNFIKIFPNPFKNNFTIAVNPPLTSVATFSLYDAAGKLYFAKKVSVQSGVIQVIHFNQMQLLQKGIYILKYNDGKNKKSLKLMAQ
ncbi:T9SS C-terminal target domain-containing protein [Hanamia caeni]|uniref:T9SS C-terminal target domain-containing protein n=1 Tax=Hanamia caeni TaxID=2294116 RepID=A0A3M9NFM9_9BACT|nr:S8 family peptidase [Hanamia caeni]RNI36590.1 T9SS C-terminal target domain-containing protein [Hanamia caeni]